MTAHKRRRVIAGNWKMYKNQAETRAFVTALKPMVADTTDCDIVVAPPFIDIPAAVQETAGTNIAISAQDVFWEKEGAYTGEICASMLVAVGVTHVIIGHSERRQYFGETDDIVNNKLKSALEAGLTPIVCVGELLAEREAGADRAQTLEERSAGERCVAVGHGDGLVPRRPGVHAPQPI